MLHGGGPGASAWSNFGSALPGFATSFRTLLVDQPGFGGSDKPPVVGNYFRFSADYVVQDARRARASTGCTCSATAWAAVRRCGWRSATPTGSVGWC